MIEIQKGGKSASLGHGWYPQPRFPSPDVSHTIATIMPRYSISVRLRRTKVEYAFVSGPIDEYVLERDPEDNTKLKISAAKVSEAAKRLGADGSVLWPDEASPLIELHPLQTAPPRA